MSTGETNLKKEALHRYPTQEAVMEPFLRAFVRSTELFGQTGIERIDEKGVILKDAVADTLTRTFEGPADIKKVVIAKVNDALKITVETRKPATPAISYAIGLRMFGGGVAHRIDLVVRDGNIDALSRASNSVLPEKKSVRIENNQVTLEIQSPYLESSDSIMVSAMTYLKSKMVDKTAWRLFSL